MDGSADTQLVFPGLQAFPDRGSLIAKTRAVTDQPGHIDQPVVERLSERAVLHPENGKFYTEVAARTTADLAHA